MRRYSGYFLIVLLLVFVTWLFSGCSLFPSRPRIRIGDSIVTPPPDAGKPATLSQDTSVGSLPIPAGSKLVVTKWAAVPWKPATENSPAVAAQPGREVTEVILTKPTEWRKTETNIQAETGTVDTTLAKHRIDVAENRYLLWASLGAAAAAGFFLYIKYPTPAFICGGAALVFFIAWKLADLPSYFWAFGACGLVLAFGLWRGHERGEVHATDAIMGKTVEPRTPTAEVEAPLIVPAATPLVVKAKPKAKR